MTKIGEWVHARTEGNYVSASFPDREAAVTAGRLYYKGAEFWVAQVTRTADKASQLANEVWSDPVRVMFHEAASAFPGMADGWPRCTDKQNAELTHTLRVKIDQWADAHDLHPYFLKVALNERIAGGEAVPVVEDAETAEDEGEASAVDAEGNAV